MSELDVRKWDHALGEWITVTVDVPPEPRAQSRRKPSGSRPIDVTTLNHASPLSPDWRYTAYGPGEPLADMRTHVPDPTTKTHRPAVVSWRKFDDLPSDRSEWTREDYDVAGTARRVFATITKGK
jgi:hypothetical protein